MRRADRLFQLVLLLRSRQVRTAAWLALRLGVSQRTVYRDIRDLTRSGVPVLGEAGVGYQLQQGFDLPPLMFDATELEALVLGARMVRAWADPELQGGARSALEKIENVLPPTLRQRVEQTLLFSLNFQPPPQQESHLALLRQALREQRLLRFEYRRADGTPTLRRARPLCLSFTAPHWLLTAWCELRGGFRNFRLDRLGALELLPETFQDEPGRTLKDFLRQMRGQAEESS